MIRPLTLTMLLAAAALANGCRCCPRTPNPSRQHGEQFTPDTQLSAVTRFAIVQSAAGVRADATLRAAHFDGDALNGLGEERLDLLLQDPRACCPLTLYVDASADALPARQRAVMAFLKDRGMKESQVRLLAGPNPASVSPAAPQLAHMRKTDSGIAEAASPPTPAPGPAPASGN